MILLQIAINVPIIRKLMMMIMFYFSNHKENLKVVVTQQQSYRVKIYIECHFLYIKFFDDLLEKY